MRFPHARSRRAKVFLPVMLLVVSGCMERQVSAKPDLKTTRELIGPNLPGTMGRAPEDQQAIDLTVAGLCETEVFDRDQCAAHTAASRTRWRAFHNAARQSPGV